MIKVKGAEAHFSGDIPKLFIELVILLHTFLEMVEEEMSKEDAEKMLTLAGKLAVLDADDLGKKFDEIIEDFKNDSFVR